MSFAADDVASHNRQRPGRLVKSAPPLGGEGRGARNRPGEDVFPCLSGPTPAVPSPQREREFRSTCGVRSPGGGAKSRSDPARGAHTADGEFDLRSSLTHATRAVSLGGAPRSGHGHVALRPIRDTWCSGRTSRDGSCIPCVREQRHRPSSTSGRRANDQEPCRAAGRDGRVSLRPGNTSATRCRPADGCRNSSGFRARGLRPTWPNDVLLSVPAAAGRGQRWPAPIAKRS